MKLSDLEVGSLCVRLPKNTRLHKYVREEDHWLAVDNPVADVEQYEGCRKDDSGTLVDAVRSDLTTTRVCVGLDWDQHSFLHDVHLLCEAGAVFAGLGLRGGGGLCLVVVTDFLQCTGSNCNLTSRQSANSMKVLLYSSCFEPLR